MKNLRRYIRRVLQESARLDRKAIYRGMKIDVGDAGLASQIRNLARGKKSYLTEREAGAFIMAGLREGEVGESWTTSRDVAANFADVWEAKNRGSVLHVMFTAYVPEGFGYNPQEAEEEPGVFADESEVRIPKGEDIEILAVSVFIADKSSAKNWQKFKKVAYKPGVVKA